LNWLFIEKRLKPLKTVGFYRKPQSLYDYDT